MHIMEIREIWYNLSAITKPEINDSSNKKKYMHEHLCIKYLDIR